MKILIVMAGFFPGKKYGGPPVSVDNFCTLMTDADCYIVTRNHDNGDDSAYDEVPTKTWINRNNCSVMYLSDLEYNENNFENVIDEIKPDLIYLQGLFQRCVLPCLHLASKKNLRVLLAPRGELCAGAFKKKYKKMPYIYFLRIAGLLRNVSFQSTSEEETASIVRFLKTKETNIFFLTNIPSIPKKEYIKSEKKRGNGKFVFLSRIHPKKNLLEAIRFFSQTKGNVVFDIYGPIEDKNYWDECREEIKKLPGNIFVQYCGLVSHDQVHEVFSRYDAFVFPTLSENFGHVIAESLIVGTPVIISNQTPWSNLSKFDAGWDIPLSNRLDFVNAIQSIIDSDNEMMQRMNAHTIEYICEKYKIDALKENYINAMTDIFERG